MLEKDVVEGQTNEWIALRIRVMSRQTSTRYSSESDLNPLATDERPEGVG